MISTVKSACVFHNYIRKHKGKIYEPRKDFNINENTQMPNGNLVLEVNGNVNLMTAKGMRDFLSGNFL